LSIFSTTQLTIDVSGPIVTFVIELSDICPDREGNDRYANLTRQAFAFTMDAQGKRLPN
jgi:hypothetical protein